MPRDVLGDAALERARGGRGCVLRALEGDGIAAIIWFADTALFAHFGLPRTLRS